MHPRRISKTLVHPCVSMTVEDSKLDHHPKKKTQLNLQ